MLFQLFLSCLGVLLLLQFDRIQFDQFVPILQDLNAGRIPTKTLERRFHRGGQNGRSSQFRVASRMKLTTTTGTTTTSIPLPRCHSFRFVIIMVGDDIVILIGNGSQGGTFFRWELLLWWWMWWWWWCILIIIVTTPGRHGWWWCWRHDYRKLARVRIRSFVRSLQFLVCYVSGTMCCGFCFVRCTYSCGRDWTMDHASWLLVRCVKFGGRTTSIASTVGT